MNFGKNDTICFKRYIYLLICNELSCIDQGIQLLLMTNTMNIITIPQPSNLNLFLHDYFLQCNIITEEIRYSLSKSERILYNFN